ncbi:hypothetical protein KUCAC02_017898 [Chaenocephalus aceratus]|nr:hypothetical protein KUCAC02_026702 [Chaenocephalus aceratus]KAI4799143.1 hypothetical protein KUCAC02_017898 [Chaenocephalus aceratus]
MYSIGKHNAKQLSNEWPRLLGVQCAATSGDHLEQLHLYFRNSANRSASQKEAAEVLGVCELKVKQVKDTRWLSQHEAVKTLSAALGALAEEVETRTCPTAKGLYSFLATCRFLAALHLQADVLPHLARLSKIFQREDVMLLPIKEQVPVTLALLKGRTDSGVINRAHTGPD